MKKKLINNPTDGFNIRVDKTEGRISEKEDRSEEII
jgi:hypothetical protein